MLPPIFTKARANSGATAVELALLLPLVLLCVLGLAEFGRALWTQATLDYAVQAAARCAAIDTNTCGSGAQTQQYAISMAPALSVTASQFTVTNPSCGMRVSTSLPFQFVVPALFPYSLTLTATACFPT